MPMPKQPIPKGLADAGLLALYHHIEIRRSLTAIPAPKGFLAARAINVSRKTDERLAEGVRLELTRRHCYELLTQRVLQSRVIPNDDTLLPVRKRRTPAETKTGRLWDSVERCGQLPYTVFHYTPNHSGEWPAEFSKEYKGYLQVDAFTGYERVCSQSGDIIEAACWAHVRRKFFRGQRRPTNCTTISC